MLKSMTAFIASGAIALGTVGTPTTGADGKFGPSNPFYAPSTLPFQAPPFDKIKDADYQPAIEAACASSCDEMDAIANNPAPPTFENTLVAMEKTGQLLNRALAAFNAVTGANTNPTCRRCSRSRRRSWRRTRTRSILNPKLFARVRPSTSSAQSLQLDPESQRLRRVYYTNFVHAGRQALATPTKTKLKKLNEEESKLSNDVHEQLLAATKDGGLHDDRQGALAGLTDAQIAAAAQARRPQARRLCAPAAEHHAAAATCDPQRPRHPPGLSRILDPRRARRRQRYARHRRAAGAAARREGASCWAIPTTPPGSSRTRWPRRPKRAAIPERAGPGATAKARAEAKEFRPSSTRRRAASRSQPWDWNFYAEQVRKAKYDLDESQVKPYFELNNVLENGVFYAAHQLYGLTFKERKDIPVCQPDVRVFEVLDADGKPLALFYCDYFKRDNKNGGAWMNNFVDQSKLLGTCRSSTTWRTAQARAGRAALISFDDVTTMFHEFGHALHGMFAKPSIRALSGTSRAARLRRVPLAVQRALGDAIPRSSALREALQDRRADAGGAGREDQEGATSTRATCSPSCWPPPCSTCSGTRFPPARRCRTRMRSRSRRWRRRTADLQHVPPRYRSSYFPAHLGVTVMPPAITPICGREMLDRRCLSMVRGTWRPDARQRRPLPQDGASRGNTEDLAEMYAAWRGGIRASSRC